MRDKIELLAPAGDFASLVAAVQNGADAIYLGGNMFNARRNAANFDYKELERAIRYAHLYGVRVYITLNILIKEHELAEAIDFLHLLDKLNVDGVIIQDIGIIGIIKEEVPGLPIHGSTQMTIHNLEGLHALQDLGLSRGILAREVTLNEIENMGRNSHIDLEAFVHGALCICYSGQCLMSSMIGGRSGNRGMCAQPCRLKYELIDTDGEILRDRGHLLSPKDLSSYDFLQDIIDAGVSSLKIEGRMKRPEYVGIITRAYRQLIDTGSPAPETRQELLQIFNRGGFTAGYYFGMKNRELICAEKPNNWGVYLGDVVEVSRDDIKIALREDLTIGDGIEFWLECGDNWGQFVDAIYIGKHTVERAYAGQTISLSTKKKVALGTRVYRTSSIELLEDIRASFRQPYDYRKIPVAMEGHFKVGEHPYVKIRDEQGNIGISKGDNPVERAINSPLTYDDMSSQLDRLGGTPFSANQISLNMDDNVFMPKSAINGLRREAVDGLIEDRIGNFKFETFRRPISSSTIDDIKPKPKPKLMLYTSAKYLDDKVVENVDGICLYPTDWRSFDIDDCIAQIERYRSFGKIVRLVLPRIMHKDDMELISSLDPRTWTAFDGYQGGNLGTVYLLKQLEADRIIGDFSLNITNSSSLKLLKDLGVESAVLSPELTIGELGDIIRKRNMDCEILVYGHIPLMIMQYCPVGVDDKGCSSCAIDRGVFLKDRKGVKFPIMRIQLAKCYSQILNGEPLFTAHQMQNILKLDVEYLGLYDIYHEGDLEVITGLYRYAIDHIGENYLKDMHECIQKIVAKGYTNGHFFRGVY